MKSRPLDRLRRNTGSLCAIKKRRTPANIRSTCTSIAACKLNDPERKQPESISAISELEDIFR